MQHNKKIFFFTTFCFVFILSTNFVFAQDCSDPIDLASEKGMCLSACDPATEHEILGTCAGQVCCAANPPGALPIAPGGAGTKGAGQSCALTSECGSGLTCYAASGVAQTTCQAVGSSGGGGTGFPTGSTSAGAGGSGWSLGNISGFGLPAGSVMGIVQNILVWILGLFGIIGILGFLISGIIYLTAAGDEDRMAYAKRAMMYSIIGVIVGLIGFVIIQAIDYALNMYSIF